MDGQISMDWPKAHSHRGDPETSVDAAKSAETFHRNHIDIVVDVLRAAGIPLAVEQFMERCDLERYQIARRLSDLSDTKNGKQPVIVDSGLRHTNKNGKKAVRWWFSLGARIGECVR